MLTVVAAKQVEGRRKVNKKLAGGDGVFDGPDKWMMDLLGKTGASAAFEDDYKKDDGVHNAGHKLITENF